MAEIVYLSNVRLSFPHLVEPHSSGQGAPAKFSADLILNPQDPNLQKFMTEVNNAAIEKWKENAGQVLQFVNQDRKLRCYGPGEEVVNRTTFQPYDGYVGNYHIGASRDEKPQMIKPDGGAVDPINTMEYQAFARKLYGGCYVNVALRPWTQDNTHGRGIRCDLVAIQFNADGEAFGEGTTDASTMFGQAAAPTQAAPAMAGMPAQATPNGMAMPPAQQAAPAMGMPAAPYPTQEAPVQQPAPTGLPGMPSFLG